ncbi:monocarboxylate transporter 14 isoform X2 [Macrobrachium rosenbergii]|uniref:monocarboxylate transporter 14 isoform X2 n=1 Tax=Macrobrachium rosenbergii TaxID=79674 RepID=UPI0034D3C5D8
MLFLADLKGSSSSPVFSPSITMVEVETNGDGDTTSLKPSDGPAKFVIGASDEDFEETEAGEAHMNGIRPDRKSLGSKSLDTTQRATHVVPPDGGWGWVVVAASFMCNLVVDGIIFSCGMLLPELQQSFNASMTEVSLVSSMLGGFYLIVGPFVSALANAYGFRTVCILGAVIASCAFGLSYFATSIYFLHFSFGIIGGTGFGFIYVPAVIATGFYFEKRRALATGIAVCGSGIGTFIFAPLNSYLITNVGWRMACLVYAGISLTCAIFGLAFRPLEPVAIADDLEPKGTPLLMRIKRARDEQLRQCASALSMASVNSKSTIDELGGMEIKGNGVLARTLLERHGGGTHKRYSFPGIVVSGPDTIHEETETCLIEPEEEKCLTTVSGEVDGSSAKMLDNNKNETEMKNIQGTTNQASGSEAFVVKPNYPRNKSAPALALQNSSFSSEHRRPSRSAIRTEMARPFYRDDIFYSGSLMRLPQYQSSETVEKYHMSVTQLPPMEDIAEEEISGGRCRCCPTAVTNVINRIFDFSLLASPTFVILSIAGFLSLMALFVPFMFLPGYASKQGSDEGSQATLVATIGITNTVGRIICGWVSDHPKVDALFVNNLSLMLGGGATVILPFFSDESLLLCYAVIFGFAVAAFASLRSILLVELLGLEKLTNAFGLLLLFQGIAALFGSPTAGAFVDATKSYDLTFYVFGGIFAFSGFMCIPLRYLKNWEDKRNEKKIEEKDQNRI